jgi:transposase
MRRQINGLSLLVEELDQEPFSGSLYLFCGRDRKRLKALYWDRNGFCLWQKRLERDTFPWPRTAEEVREITEAELRMLLSGIDFFHAHQRLSYRSVS